MSEQSIDEPAYLVCIHDLVDPATGRTTREENLLIQHNIPTGTLVEVAYTHWHGGGCCEAVRARLWVVRHDRDCDGSPLYCLSQYKTPSMLPSSVLRPGFSEDALTPVDLSDPQVQSGDLLPEWYKEVD